MSDKPLDHSDGEDFVEILFSGNTRSYFSVRSDVLGAKFRRYTDINIVNIKDSIIGDNATSIVQFIRDFDKVLRFWLSEDKNLEELEFTSNATLFTVGALAQQKFFYGVELVLSLIRLTDAVQKNNIPDQIKLTDEALVVIQQMGQRLPEYREVILKQAKYIKREFSALVDSMVSGIRKDEES